MDFKIGDEVSLSCAVPYLKTAEPMPMLRPPDLVSLDETGVIVGLRTAGTVEVRFRRGNFLLSVDQLKKSF